MSDRFSYDLVAYQSHATPAMHPDRLFVQGRLFGLTPAPAGRCRYLEVGGGSGTNLIAAALYLPDSQFVGVDLAESAVQAGNATIAALGLTNVRLVHADLTAWQPDGPFDYVAAHGVYSWVPGHVRDGLMALVKRALAPDGVGYVSYNALPGCHLRRVVWDMLKFHTASLPDPAAKLAQVDGFLQFVCDAQENQPDPPNRWLLAEAGRVLGRTEKSLTYHDDLAGVNDPVYFLDFVEHARGHGLQFVAEAELPTMSDAGFPPQTARVLADLGRQNPLMREQYRDFLKVRRFRASLVTHADRPVLPAPDPDVLPEFRFSTGYRAAGEPADGEKAEFVSPAGGAVKVGDPVARRLLTVLGECRPERVPFADLAGGDPGPVARSLLAMALADLVACHRHRPALAVAAGDRPSVSPLARLQAAAGQPVSTLLHTTLDLTDPASQALIPLLDGTRTRADLTAALHAAVPALGTVEEVADGLEITLEKLARAGMLVA